MRITFGLRNRAAVQVALGRKSQRLKTGLRRVVQQSSARVFQTATRLCPVSPAPRMVRFRSRKAHLHLPGFMRRNIRVTFTPAGLGYDVGWRGKDFADADEPFYPPWVVLGTRRSGAQDPLTPAWREERPVFERDIVALVRSVGRSR